MNRVFQTRGYFAVPDGTEVSPFLNATDSMQKDLPWGVLGDVSIASGRIAPHSESWIHVHPVVTQVTYVLSGQLHIHMRDPGGKDVYELGLASGEAVVTQPGTLFQLRNSSDAPSHVLYVVSPTYVFEMNNGKVIYDDAVLVAKTWGEIDDNMIERLSADAYEVTAKRGVSLRRLAAQKNRLPNPLSSEELKRLPKKADYLAPDGSEIRLLVKGERGDLAHCLLPAGKVSMPVKPRTVEELWYVLEGEGTVWRGREGEPDREDSIKPGDSLRIPVDVSFQFRASAKKDLKILITTMPPWPGKQEAVKGAGMWVE
jgi:mannose-6-phosphate isomerase-like protein (cupin superfamily)